MMDEDTLKKYEHYLKPISKTTQQRIEKVLTDSKYLRFHGVLEKILQLNGTLEQEAIELK
jgi:hypothetical protein